MADLHKNIPVGAESAHPPGYVQPDDPGAIGANKPWQDTTGAGDGYYTPKLRNAANDAFLSANATHLGGVEAADYATKTYVDNAVAGAGGTPVTSQSGTSYTFDADDANTLVRFTSGSAVTATVPTNASVAYPIGTTIAIEQAGAGAVEVEGDTGVTVNSPPGGTLTTAGQYAMVQLIKVDDDEWTLFGHVEAAS